MNQNIEVIKYTKLLSSRFKKRETLLIKNYGELNFARDLPSLSGYDKKTLSAIIKQTGHSRHDILIVFARRQITALFYLLHQAEALWRCFTSCDKASNPIYLPDHLIPLQTSPHSCFLFSSSSFNLSCTSLSTFLLVLRLLLPLLLLDWSGRETH